MENIESQNPLDAVTKCSICFEEHLKETMLSLHDNRLVCDNCLSCYDEEDHEIEREEV